MTRGGRPHRAPGTLLVSAAPARRGYATAAPARATGAGPRGAARRRRSAPGRSGPWSARPSSPPRPFTPERRRRSRVCPAEGEGQAGGGGGGVVVPLQRGLLCPCAEMTHGVPSRHARAQRTDTHKERGKYTAPARRPQQLPGPPRPGPPRAVPTPQPCAPPHPTWRPNSARARSAKYRTRVPGKCGADQAGCAVAAAPGQTDGRVAATSMPGWGAGAGEGTKRGAALSAPAGRSAHPHAGPSRRSAPTGSPRPLCRAPLCAARNAAVPWRPREHARRAGAGGTRSGTVCAGAARPTRAARRPSTPAGRRDGAAGAAGKALRSPRGLGARAGPGCSGGRLGV